MSGTNFSTTLGERPFHIDKAAGDPPLWFQETPPAHPGSPSAIVYPDTLNLAEQIEVQTYLQNPTDAVLASLRLPASIAKANEYKTYYASPVIKAYLAAKDRARTKQWKWFNADAAVDNQPTISKSADSAGSGSTPPNAVVPVSEDVPAVTPTVATPTPFLGSGTLGVDPIDITLSCSTGGATIFYNVDGGAWAIYSGIVTVAAGSIMYFYASKSGYSDSLTSSFDNS